MSFSSYVKQLYLDRDQVAFRPAENYGVGANGLFTIQGGPVLIKAFFARFTAAETTGATFAAACAGVDLQTAAVDVDGAINTLAIFPLEDTAGSVLVPDVLANILPTAGAWGNNAFTLLSSVGDIVLTVAVAATDGLPEFFVVYQPLHPAANIVLA